MKVKLTVQSGARDKTLDLRLPTTIGRSRDVSLRVRNTQVSRKHCKLYEEEGELWVDDLGSANGTFVNKEKVAGKTLLANGDRLNVGPVAFRVEMESPKQAEVPEDSEIQLDGLEPAASESDAAGLSDLDYQETSDGSFIGIIDDNDNETEPMGAPAEDEIAPKESLDPVAAADDLTETVEVAFEKPSESVKAGDSALNDFFKGLD